MKLVLKMLVGIVLAYISLFASATILQQYPNEIEGWLYINIFSPIIGVAVYMSMSSILEVGKKNSRIVRVVLSSLLILMVFHAFLLVTNMVPTRSSSVLSEDAKNLLDEDLFKNCLSNNAKIRSEAWEEIGKRDNQGIMYIRFVEYSKRHMGNKFVDNGMVHLSIMRLVSIKSNAVDGYLEALMLSSKKEYRKNSSGDLEMVYPTREFSLEMQKKLK